MHGDVLFQRIVTARESAARIKAAVDVPILPLSEVAGEGARIRQVLTSELLPAVSA
jgi:hypothetical protein